MGLEFGVKSIPAIILLVAGTIRVCNIKHVATGSVRYSNHFKTKIALCILMGLAYLSAIPTNYALSANAANGNTSWFN